jgi:hypothetical protein
MFVLISVSFHFIINGMSFSFMLSASDKIDVSKKSQIFDVRHLEDILNTAHVCTDGGRLQFISDVLPSTGLFHQNILRCTKCLEETPMTNFPIVQPLESEQQEPNKLLTLAAATTCVGYRAIKGIMSMLALPIQSERTFLHQLHKHYDGLHHFAQQHFKKMINDIKIRSKKEQKIMNTTVSIDGTWKRRGHVSNFGIVYIIDVQSGLCIDYEVMSLLCELCNTKKKNCPKLNLLSGIKNINHFVIKIIMEHLNQWKKLAP